MITSIRISRKIARYRGAAIVEAAIVMVLLMMFMLGTYAFGYLFLRAEQITNAARQGARTAIRWNATEADVQNAVADSLKPYPAIVPTYGPGGIDPDPCDPVTVIVESSGLDIMHINTTGKGILPIPDSFKASVTMAKEGP